MTQGKKRLWIHDRKEIGLFLILSLGVAFFAFTLGVHLGKKVGQAGVEHHEAHIPPVEASPVPELEAAKDIPLNRAELTKLSPEADEAAKQALQETLREEIVQKQLRAEKIKSTELPDDVQSIPEVRFTTKHKAFVLQLGSHANRSEADLQMKKLAERGLDVQVVEASVSGKGTRYRIYFGNYASKAAAEDEGKALRFKNLIDSYVVIKQ